MRQEQSNTVGHKTAWNFLLILIGASVLSASINTVSAESLRGNKPSLQIQPFEMFARADVGGAGGIYEFVKGTTAEAVGICNFDKARLPINEAFIFNEISIGYSIDVTDIPGGVAYSSVLPNALRNSEFLILQDGREVVNMPTASLSNPAALGNNGQDQWQTLGSLTYLKDDVSFTFAFRFPDGQTIDPGVAGSTFPYVEVRLRGWKTSKK